MTRMTRFDGIFHILLMPDEKSLHGRRSKMKKINSKWLTFTFSVMVLQGWFILPLAFSQPKQVSEKEKQGGTLTIATPLDPKSLDSRYLGAWGWQNTPGHQQIYERLIEYGPKADSASLPALAESWEQLDDVTWLVRIRKGVKFHHGRELTAADIKTQIGWAMETPKGWRAIRHSRSAAAMIKQLDLVDPYTLKFTLKQPEELFISYIMGWSMNGVAPPELVEKWGKEFSIHPTGTGPFKFVEWVSGDHLTMERFDGYWGRKPYLDKVVFRFIPDPQTRFIALQKGEAGIADIPFTSLPQAKKDPNLRLYSTTTNYKQNGGGFNFNLRRWPVNQLKFRQAIAMGADWGKIAKVAVPYGQALMKRCFLEGSWAYDPKAEKILPPYNPEKAKQLIREVEKEAGRPIPPLYALTRDGGTFADFLKIAENELKKIGVPLNVQIHPYDVAKDKRQRDPKMEWDINIWGQSRGPGFSPIFFLDLFRTDRPGAPDNKNIWAYSNPKVDELIKAGRRGGKDRKKLKGIYQEIERILLTDMPYIPVWDEPVIYGVNKRVHDFFPHPTQGIFLTSPYNNIWVEKR